ncbi:MAG: transposase [Deltaproteobacteria bacterium]|nr:transposase [Deltaproteobacteria bacterium]
MNFVKYKRRPRLKKFDYLGRYGYFITICTHNKKPYFRKPLVVNPCIESLIAKAKTFNFNVVVYCFMPDHVHFLAKGMKSYSNLKKFVSSYKQSTGYVFGRSLKTQSAKYPGRAKALNYDEPKTNQDVAQGFSPAMKIKLWQSSFYDHVLRNDEDVLEIAKYIVNNPVRRKVVTDYKQYPFSGPIDLIRYL